jgi:N-alpha-acetyltransferase 35, NatC auxiliary subunit
MSIRTEPQMPAPVPGRPSVTPRSPVMAVEVTIPFNNAASALKTGQLVKQDDFTLFEAVSALEVCTSSVNTA